jgi:hypothetical protein
VLRCVVLRCVEFFSDVFCVVWFYRPPCCCEFGRREAAVCVCVVVVGA